MSDVNLEEGIRRGIVNYTSRDYESILNDFVNAVPTLTELWKPDAEADPGMVLAKYIASVADVLGINLDLMANEVYAPSVSQRKNAEKIFSLIGYELGWYTSARTEITFTNISTDPITLDFGFNGANFATVNAYTDITNQSRVITYNILPLTNKYGATDTRSRRDIITTDINVFADTDEVHLDPDESVTRVGIEGELRSYTVSVQQVKDNNYIVKLPSQHIDTTAIWIKAKTSLSATDFLETQWIQCSSPAEFISPEPRFAVTYDSYSNAQIQISNYLNQLENYASNYLTIYWIDSSGIIGCVGEDVLSNYLTAKQTGTDISSNPDILTISNLSNTVELPNTNTVTGASPETAKEAYYNSRNYINTFDSLVTLPDYQRFLNREPGVDCGYVIDCQKALDINLAIYHDENLTDEQKSKKYITKYDFPEGDTTFDWKNILQLGFDPTDPQKYVFAANFKTYTAMCFAIHNDFNNSSWGQGQTSNAQFNKKAMFTQYKPPEQFIQNVIRDYRPFQAMSVELQFGYLRIFEFYCVMQVFTKKPVTQDVGNTIIAKIKETLALYFAPANREIGVLPTYQEIIDVSLTADTRIKYVDLGSIGVPNYGIIWKDCDIDCFNAISFARFKDPGTSSKNIRIHPECLVRQ